MLEVTVKTLENQNHTFSVDDEITVAQFKQHIAPTVNILADTQRMIYCGRVLQDASKLNDYDINGKVVHLVERPPPSSTQPNRAESPEQQRRRFRGLEYLGSMRIPSNVGDSQHSVPPLPTHSLAASRLNVARRMLRKAEGVLNFLENPTSRPSETPNQEETQEEVTPVFEARVFVPSNSNNHSFDGLVSAIQNRILHLRNSSLPSDAPPPEPSDAAGASAGEIGTPYREIDTPEEEQPASSSETSAGENRSAEPSTSSSANNAQETNDTGRPSSENISRTSEYADLLENLGRVQTRFSPFMAQYCNFMRNDPATSAENNRETQIMINRVSEVLHFLGHAYHSLSDIIVQARTPPPRPLHCVPILIQHSAVVQAGIPIQVEAQINFPAERNGANNTTATGTGVQSTTAPQTTTTSTTSASNQQVPASVHATPFVGIPLLGPRIHVNTFTVPRHPVPAPSATAASNSEPNESTTEPNQNSEPTTGSTRTDPHPTSLGLGEWAFPSVLESLVPNAAPSSLGGSNQFPNMEFFMEVTPEVVQGSLNAAPPELMQSIMQMAGHLISRTAQGAAAAAAAARSSTTTATTTIPSETTAAENPSARTTTNAGAARTTPFQNSQARSTTQTYPTTATYTRSTSRPHVHLAQHTMQGFDPFLPCNSHHVTRRRRQQPQQTANAQEAPQGQEQSRPQSTAQPRPRQDGIEPLLSEDLLFLDGVDNPYARFTNERSEAGSAPRNEQNNSLYNIFQTVINSFRTAQNGREGSSNTPPQTSLPLSAPVTFLPWMMHLQNMNPTENQGNATGPTIASLLEQLPDNHYVEGENMFTDLIMTLARNFTISDVILLNSGRIDPLTRVESQLRSFVVDRVLEGNQTPTGIERGVDRAMNEMQQFLENLSILPTRDDIDIVSSVRNLLRAGLVRIISLTISNRPNSLYCLVEQTQRTIRQMFALILFASQDGIRGVFNAFNQIALRYMQGIPHDLQQWTLMTSRVQIRQYLTNGNVPENVLQPYIVRKSQSGTSSTFVANEPQANANLNVKPADESMEVDEPEIACGSRNELNDAEVAELPGDIGSEMWHNQVAANWVPIIARDSHKQRRQCQQAPFSDAYLSGLPTKRRKLVASAKSQGSLSQVISESVRRAASASGLISTVPIGAVAEAAGEDPSVQAAYRDLVRNTVQSTLRDNEDFTPERFPNANNYFSPNP